MTGSKALCRVCLMAYSTLVVVLTAVYLWSKWGVHRSFFEVLEETKRHNDDSADVNGVAFAESGCAEYTLVALSHVLHLICLMLFLFGAKSGVKMVLGSALLCMCAVMYIFVYGCMTLQGGPVPQGSYDPSKATAAHQRKQKDSQAYQVKVDSTDSPVAVAGTAASPGNGERQELSCAAAEKVSGESGTCGMASAHTDERISYVELGWVVLETLVDVLAIFIVGPDSPTGITSARLHPDGTPMHSGVPFAEVHRFSLLMLSCIGFALSMWGVTLFDVNPALTSAAGGGGGGGGRGRSGFDNGARAAGRKAIASATLVNPVAGAGKLSAAAVEAKKCQ